jgi:hypothetical protein
MAQSAYAKTIQSRIWNICEDQNPSSRSCVCDLRYPIRAAQAAATIKRAITAIITGQGFSLTAQ